MKTTIKVSIRIIILFSVAMVMASIPQLFPDFFGDKICTGHIKDMVTGNEYYYEHYGDRHYDETIHWGYIHWLYFLMGLSLASVQIADIIKILNNPKD